MIYVLCGTIASGKSTLAKKLAELEYIVINDDAIVNAVHGGNYTLYDKKLKPLYKSIENHIFTTAIAMDKDLVIDRGLNNTIKSRQRWISLARSLDQVISAVIFPIELAEVHALRRMNSNNRGISHQEWIEIAEKHIKEYEPPTLNEGFFSIIQSNSI